MRLRVCALLSIHCFRCHSLCVCVCESVCVYVCERGRESVCKDSLHIQGVCISVCVRERESELSRARVYTDTIVYIQIRYCSVHTDQIL